MRAGSGKPSLFLRVLGASGYALAAHLANDCPRIVRPGGTRSDPFRVEANSGKPAFGIGTKWNKLGVEGNCKYLEMWWPGTDLVPLPPLTACKLLFLRRARCARKARPASFWHTIGTLSSTRDLSIVGKLSEPFNPGLFNGGLIQEVAHERGS